MLREYMFWISGPCSRRTPSAPDLMLLVSISADGFESVVYLSTRKGAVRGDRGMQEG